MELGIHLDDECIELLNETGSVLVPTLAIVNRIYEHGEDHGIPEFGPKKAREAHEAHIESVRRGYEAGVTVAFDADFVGAELIPHGEKPEEMILYVEKVGVGSMDSIKTGTANVAETIPESRTGTIVEENFANLIVLSDNPLNDTTAVQNSTSTVYKEGSVVETAGSKKWGPQKII